MKFYAETNMTQVITFYLYAVTEDAELVIGPLILMIVCGMNSKPSLAPRISFKNDQSVE